MTKEQKKALRSVLGGLGVIVLLGGVMTPLYPTNIGLLFALAIWVVGIPALGIFGLGTEEETEEAETKTSSATPIVGIVIGTVIIIGLVTLAGLGLLVSSVDGGLPGDVVSESRNVTDFSRVELRGSGDLIIDQTGKESLEIEAGENLMDRIEARVVGDTLRLGLKEKWFIWPFWPSNPIEYNLSVDELEHITITGSGSVVAKSLEADSLGLSIIGSGEGDLSVDANKLDVSISGSGDFTLAGKAKEQELTISGSGEVDAQELRSKAAEITINGSGSVIVDATDDLDVNISGSGDVQYLGRPSIDQRISGSGDISQY